MGRQADDDPGQGEEPRQGGSLPELPAGFEHGGAWDAAAPSAGLAAALEAAAGPEGLYEGAETDALVGMVRQWAAIESWAAAGLLGALRAMMREDAGGKPLLRRRNDLPEGWSDSLNYEVAGALAMGPVSAGNLAGLAWTLGLRLPGVGRLLGDGTLTKAKAKLIAQVFEPLTEDEAARAEALIVGELPGKTWFQVERLAWRAALAVAPDAARRRRSAAERERARVTVFREESGAVGLSGRDLPADAALSGHAGVLARAAEYEASGAFPGQTASSLQALAFTDLLKSVTADDRIAFARGAGGPPAGPEPDEDEPEWQHPPGGGPGGGPVPAPPGEAGDHGGTAPGGDGAGSGERHGAGGDSREDTAATAGEAGRDAEAPGHDGGTPDPGQGYASDRGPDGTGTGPGDSPGPGGDGGGGPDEPGGPAMPPAARSPLPEVVAPLATLRRRAERAGDSRLLGPLDPALARDLATAAARSPYSRWEVTIIDERGYAVGHGIARPGRGRDTPIRPPGPAATALPARVNITVTEALLRQLAAQPAQPRSGAPPGDWELVPGKLPDPGGDPAGYGTWTLTLPGGRPLTVRFDVVPTHSCDHGYRVSAYLPGDRLRRLVQVRDRECTFPPCSRPARESDFEHAVPYDKGGRTCGCNAGARSRRCHQVKQMPGWTVTQPEPGWHVWTTPTGRTYTQEPWRYTA